jgi:hypothetical protein
MTMVRLYTKGGGRGGETSYSRGEPGPIIF